LARGVTSSGVAVIALDEAIKDSLLRASPYFLGNDYWAGHEGPAKETWRMLFKNANMTTAFDCTFRSMLTLSPTSPYPERLIIEGSQLVWEFWHKPLRPIFDSLFGECVEWGLFLIRQTPMELATQIAKRDRPNEKRYDLGWAEKHVTQYSGKFESLRQSWCHSVSGIDGPDELRRQIERFLGVQTH
jgi:hypothetical protein